MHILEDFYSEEDYKKMFYSANSSFTNYAPIHQPLNIPFPDRLKAYPCYESYAFLIEDITTKIFVKTFEEKTKLKIKSLNSCFRKTFSHELKTMFKYGVIPHKDNKDFDYAGIIYFDIDSLYDGTAFYSSLSHREPNLIVGAKTNRCVFYDPQIPHAALQSEDTKERLIQPFFLTIIKD